MHDTSQMDLGSPVVFNDDTSMMMLSQVQTTAAAAAATAANPILSVPGPVAVQQILSTGAGAGVGADTATVSQHQANRRGGLTLMETQIPQQVTVLDPPLDETRPPSPVLDSPGPEPEPRNSCAPDPDPAQCNTTAKPKPTAATSATSATAAATAAAAATTAEPQSIAIATSVATAITPVNTAIENVKGKLDSVSDIVETTLPDMMKKQDKHLASVLSQLSNLSKLCKTQKTTVTSHRKQNQNEFKRLKTSHGKIAARLTAAETSLKQLKHQLV
jgi:hypothetical protein